MSFLLTLRESKSQIHHVRVASGALPIDGPARKVLNCPEVLAFQYPEGFETQIESAMVRFRADVERHDHKVLAYDGYGKKQIKKYGLSPDTFVQMSIQLAYFKLFGENRPTYESAQTKKYAWGRTEVCRTLSQESEAFCRAMVNPDVSAAKKAELCRAAISAHGKFMARAVDGRGADRHLLGKPP
jgi:carnitine O-acetyltransferase